MTRGILQTLRKQRFKTNAQDTVKWEQLLKACVEKSGLKTLFDSASRRLPPQPDQPNLIPDISSLDLNRSIRMLTKRSSGARPPSRRNLSDQAELLREQFEGKPEILFWHALAISYLRRDTPHTEKARELFFKIWDDHGEWMAETLNARWLVSALQTFSDHGRTPQEKQCGTVGFLYGNLIKVYETEITSAFVQKENVKRYTPGKISGLFEFQPGDDILLNINMFVASRAVDAGPSSLALVRLMACIKEGETIFRRTDDAIEGKSGYRSFDGHKPS